MVAHRGHMEDIVEDRKGGCVGARWAILNAIADWRAEDGEQRTHLIPGALYIARGLSLSREDSPPWFTASHQTDGEIPPWKVAEIRLDNDKIHLCTDDWNRRDSEKKKCELAERARRLYQPVMGIWMHMFAKYVGGAANPELVRVIEAMKGMRVPEIYKSEYKYGNTADRTPPYHPEVHPM